MAAQQYDDDDHLDDCVDTDDCPDCGGEGGYNSCPEDCCPNFYGEDGCTDPICWRRCSVCKGTGYVG